jgi:hypothetical protein
MVGKLCFVNKFITECSHQLVTNITLQAYLDLIFIDHAWKLEIPLCLHTGLTCNSDPSYKACLFYRQNVGVVCWLMNVFWRFQQVCYTLFIWFEILVLSTTFNTIFSNIVAVNLSICEKTTDILYMYVNDQLLVNINYTSSVVDRDLSLGRVKAKTIKLVFVAIK